MIQRIISQLTGGGAAAGRGRRPARRGPTGGLGGGRGPAGRHGRHGGGAGAAIGAAVEKFVRGRR